VREKKKKRSIIYSERESGSDCGVEEKATFLSRGRGVDRERERERERERDRKEHDEGRLTKVMQLQAADR
jgi:hypothetical protein